MFTLCFSIVFLSACSQQYVADNTIDFVTESADSNDNNIVETETVYSIEDETEQQEIHTSELCENDIYVGEYNDYDVNEPNLQIQKNEDGTYIVQIGIVRLVNLDDGVGVMTDRGIEFVATAPNGEELTGILTVDEDIATITFTNEVWEVYSSINEYEYYKTSDTPNIYVPY